MKMKRLLAIFTLIAVLCTFCTVGVFADEPGDASATEAAGEAVSEGQQDPPPADNQQDPPPAAPAAAAGDDTGVITDHGAIEYTEYYKDGKLIEVESEEELCKYSPVIGRVFYEDGYYEDMVIEVEHEWELISDTATCTEKGIKTYECVNCGATKTESSKALGHKWSSEQGSEEEWGKIIEEATCEHTGLAQDYCERCGVLGEKTRVIEAPDHIFETLVIDSAPHCYNEELDGKVPADMLYEEESESGGVITFVKGEYHYECIFCGARQPGENNLMTVDEYKEFTEDEEFDGHNWDSWVTEKAATCDTEGKDVRWCKHCGMEEYRITPAFEHSYTAEGDYSALVQIDTHITDCFTRYDIFKCALCGEIFHGMIIDGEFVEGEEFATESHVYPSAVQALLDKNVKSIDNNTYEKWLKDKNISKYIVESTAPDCENDGSITIKCIYADKVDGHDDGDNVTFIVKALGHDWIGWVCEHAVDEQGNEFGHWVNTCRRCGLTKDFNGPYSPEKCPEGAHKYEVWNTVEPTCTEDGKIESICTVCGDEHVDVIPATGHTYDEGTVVAPTCTEDGYTLFTCTVCGETKTEAGDPATGHDYVAETVIEASCANGGIDGKLLYTCSKCGDIYVESVPAPEHVIVVDEAVEPAVGVAGKTEGSHCEVCGEVLVAQEEIPALVANTYALDVSNITKGEKKANGKGAVIVEGDEAIENVFVRISYVYANAETGQTMCVVNCFEVGSNLSFRMPAVNVPSGFVLTNAAVVVVNNEDADVGAWADYAISDVAVID